MKRTISYLALMVTAWFCAGCYPMRSVTSPGAFGFVEDRRTRAPLAGADVSISRVWQREWPYYGVPTVQEALPGLRPPTITTGSNGRFSIPFEKKWIVKSPTTDETVRGSLVVRREGYVPVVVPLVEQDTDNVGIIYLTPAGASVGQSVHPLK